jgi:hypothetical protein
LEVLEHARDAPDLIACEALHGTSVTVLVQVVREVSFHAVGDTGEGTFIIEGEGSAGL